MLSEEAHENAYKRLITAISAAREKPSEETWQQLLHAYADVSAITYESRAVNGRTILDTTKVGFPQRRNRPVIIGVALFVLALLVPLVVYMYYVYIEAWCMAYAWAYLTGAMHLGKDPAAYGEFFEELVGVKENGLITSGGLQPAVVFLILAFALNFTLIYRGLSRGIERFCLFAMRQSTRMRVRMLYFTFAFTLAAVAIYSALTGSFFWGLRRRQICDTESSTESFIYRDDVLGFRGGFELIAKLNRPDEARRIGGQRRSGRSRQNLHLPQRHVGRHRSLL